MNLSEHSVFFLNHEFAELKRFIQNGNYSKVIILADTNSALYCYPLIKSILPVHELIKIEHGEENKNLQTCSFIWQKMTELELDRKALLVNIGGGVIGDMGGFCAATYKRGIDFIQIPTTLLSQVDASVGGKLGIDFQSFKNHIGVFQLPKAVFIYPDFLKTLSKQEIRSGYAEIIKHCLIKDGQEWKNLQRISKENLYSLSFDLQLVIKHSVEIKAQVVQEDPTEKGLRKVLNFGHTLGHAIETYFLNTSKKMLHGEAIAVGMILEALLSLKKGFISQSEFNQIQQYIYSIFDPISLLESDIKAIIPLTLQDKKNSHGKVKFSLLKSIGDCGFDFEISESEMREVLSTLNKKI
jgi:3-dehydroquinate synthase